MSGSRLARCRRNTSVARIASGEPRKIAPRDFAALHQIDDVDDQLLSAFDREGGDEQRAFGGRGVTKHDGKMLAPCLRVVGGRSTLP